MIKFMYFDVGGVVIKDFSASGKWKDLQISMGITGEMEKIFMKIWNKYKDQICIDYDVDNMIPEFISEIGISLPAHFSLLKEFVDRFEKNESIWPLLKRIEKKAKIGLLTGMYPRMFDRIKARNILPEIIWSEVIDSSKVRIQKPDKKIFQLAQDRAGVPPEEIFFVENSLEHVEAAKQFGWTTFLYDSHDYAKSSIDLGKFLDHVGL